MHIVLLSKEVKRSFVMVMVPCDSF
jgi:hypothetical protein